MSRARCAIVICYSTPIPLIVLVLVLALHCTTYRIGFMALTLTAYYVTFESTVFVDKFLRIGWYGLAAGIVLAGAGISYNVAILNTYTANVLVIMAANPMFAYLFSYFIFGENLPLRTGLAMGACFVAIFVVVYLAFADDFDGGWLGNTCALISSVSTAFYLVLLRQANAGKEPE
jgi:drug/metabolite transporter (DMT)-like permease